jgi:hypothetical protein
MELIVAILLPIAAFYALIGGGRLLRWTSERRSRPPVPEPPERLRANLIRLRCELETMETRSGMPAKNLRLRALRAAYVDALNDACQRLGVRSPAGAGGVLPADARQSEIYRMESVLRQRGLDVRETAGR